MNRQRYTVNSATNLKSAPRKVQSLELEPLTPYGAHYSTDLRRHASTPVDRHVKRYYKQVVQFDYLNDDNLYPPEQVAKKSCACGFWILITFMVCVIITITVLGFVFGPNLYKSKHEKSAGYPLAHSFYAYPTIYWDA